MHVLEIIAKCIHAYVIHIRNKIKSKNDVKKYSLLYIGIPYIAKKFARYSKE